MTTEKLYDADAYLAVFDAQVLACEPTEGGYGVVLDRTAFFPEEGGQHADAGTLVYDGGRAVVSGACLQDGVIVHQTDQVSIVIKVDDRGVKFRVTDQHAVLRFEPHTA